MIKLNIEEKIYLLGNNIWTKQEVAAYYDNKLSAYQLNKLFKEIKYETPFPKKTVYRNEIFRLMKTTFDEEYKNLENIFKLKK